MNSKESQKLQANCKKPLKLNKRSRMVSRAARMTLVLAFVLGTTVTLLEAQQETGNSHAQTGLELQFQAQQVPETSHRFFDKTNLMLFAGVAAVRVLDYTSTRHFRNVSNNEVLLTNSIVDDKPLFAGTEAAGVALSIGVAYWLHRTGHHKLERWVSIVHIGSGAVGDIHNYLLGAPK